MNDPANPYAAPAASAAEPAETEEAQDASRPRRLGAALLDAALYLGAALPGGIVMLLNVDFSADEPTERSLPWLLDGCGALCLGLLALFVTNLVLLSMHGQTVAKRICGIRIVHADGGRCSLGRILTLRMIAPALLRAIPYVGWLFDLVDVLFIFGDERRCLHDRIADTRVVVG